MRNALIKGLLISQYIIALTFVPQNALANSPAPQSTIQITAESGGDAINLTTEKTSKKHLEKFSPDLVTEEALKNQEKAKKSGLMIETAKEFPKESVYFFAAIGLIMASNLYTQYAKNPVALEQHVESLKDPVAHISFYTFMLANRAAMPPLMAAMGNKKLLAHAVPYLGMSIGMTASHITAELLYPLKQCVSDLMDGKRDKTKTPASCSGAYKDFVLTEKITDMVPGLVSMLASTALSTLVQQGIVTAAKSKTGTVAKLGAKQALKFVGINVITCFIPGGIFVKGGQVIGKIVQLTGFVALDHLINPLVTVPYNNFIKGMRLDRLSDQVTKHIIAHKRNAWNDPNENCQETSEMIYDPMGMPMEISYPCGKTFAEDLGEMQKFLGQWRQMNLSNTLISHDAWLKEVGKVSGNYSAAYQFYSHFLNELAVSKNQDPENQSKLDRAYYLNGVSAAIPEGYQEFPAQAFLSGPAQAERFQLVTIQKVSELLKKVDRKELFPQEKKTFDLLLSSFASSDLRIIAKGLEEYNYLHDPMRWNQAYMSKTLRELTKTMKTLLGKPRPMPELGRGYLAAYAQHPTYSQTLTYLEGNSNKFRYDVNNATEHLALQMICGPNPIKGEALINYRWGFSDEFLAPKIINSVNVDSVCSRMIPAVPNFYMYQERIQVTTAQNQQKQFRGILDLLKSEIPVGGNSPLVMTKSMTDDGKTKDAVTSNFQNWWPKAVDPHMSQAFAVYGEEYMKIVNDYVTAMRQKSFDRANGGPISNGPIYSIRQEGRLYSLILGELLTDLLVNNKLMDAAKELYSPMKVGIALNDYLKNYDDGIPLMILLLHNTPTQFGNLTSHYAKIAKTTDLKGNGKTLIWQTQIDAAFEGLIKAFEQVSTIKAKSAFHKDKETYKFSTPLNFVEIESIQKDIQDKIVEIATLLGLNETAGLVKLTDSQRKLAETAIKGLASLNQEMTQYLNIVKAVSFDEDSKNSTAQPEKPTACRSGSQRLTGMGRNGCSN